MTAQQDISFGVIVQDLSVGLGIAFKVTATFFLLYFSFEFISSYLYPRPKSAYSGLAHITALNISPTHEFSKQSVQSIVLIAGLGIDGDCHAGETVQHLARMNVTPLPKNLRQVHLIHQELFQEFEEQGHAVKPGDLGENVTTKGLDLLSLSVGTKLIFRNQGDGIDARGESAGHGSIGKENGDGDADSPTIVVTGLRNPCPQIEKFQAGLQAQCLVKEGGKIVERKCGIMATVERGGIVRVGARIEVVAPEKFVKMDVV